jgi:hypothetical protein
MQVTKANGQKELFSKEKIIKTCMNAGATKDDAIKIADEVEQQVSDGMRTRQVLKIIIRLLHKNSPRISMQYNLKGALMRLGPGGFVFEKYISKLLTSQGYTTKTNIISKGLCIPHEIDVSAKKDLETLMVECKYHNSPGIYTGVKDILYVYARFLDIREGNAPFTKPMLATNTKFSHDTIKYASCKGIKLLGWNCPENNGIAEIARKNKILPITILKSVTEPLLERFISKNVITTKDLTDENLKLLKLSQKTITNLLSEAREVENH